MDSLRRPALNEQNLTLTWGAPLRVLLESIPATHGPESPAWIQAIEKRGPNLKSATTNCVRARPQRQFSTSLRGCLPPK